jgi:hypothetical protein
MGAPGSEPQNADQPDLKNDSEFLRSVAKT